MQRIPVTSSNVLSVGYDPDVRVLEVEFSTGLYQYAFVPPDLAAELLASPSIGSFLHARIKRDFLFRKVDPVSDLHELEAVQAPE